MKLAYSGEIQHCMGELDQLIQDSLKPWWGQVLPHVDRLSSDIHYYTLPLAALAACIVQGVDRARALSMANIFRTLYLSNHIHSQIRDEAEGQLCDQQMQHDMLLSDYIFGHLIQSLLDIQAEELLDDFSLLMCRLNEAFTREHLGTDETTTIAQSKTDYYITAFRTAARLGEDRDIEGFAEIGALFGQVLNHRDMDCESAVQYGSAMGELLRELGQRRREAVLRLGKLRKDLFPDELLFTAANA